MKTALHSLLWPSCLLLAPGTAFCDDGIELVSLGLMGAEANEASDDPSISSDGRYVAFVSEANNLVAGDTNGKKDVFVLDRQSGTIVRVSRSSGGTQANDESANPDISPDGRYVAFASLASNLVAGDTNGTWDIFRHDLATGFTIRVNVTLAGNQADDESYGPAISGDGQVIAFLSYASNLHSLGGGGLSQVYVRDVVAGKTSLCSYGEFLAPGNGHSYHADVSHDGNLIVFESSATNLYFGSLVPVDNGGHSDIFLFDRSTELVSLASKKDGGFWPDDSSTTPVIAGDGSAVAFHSSASDLIPGGTLGGEQIILFDVASGTTAIVSKSTSGNHGNIWSRNPSISFDGTRVAFESRATNLFSGTAHSLGNIFVHDTMTGATTCLSRLADGTAFYAYTPSLSSNGQWLAFGSRESSIAPVDSGAHADVFARPYGVSSRNGGPNPMSYTASRPVLGEEWRTAVDLTTSGHTSAMILGTTAPAGATFNGGQKLLIGGMTLFQLPLKSGSIVRWSATLPNNPSLLGRTAYTQALHAGGVVPFALSNSQDICLGY